MNNLLNNLESIFNQEIQTFLSMIDLAREKQKILVEGNIEKLDILIKEERQIISEMTSIEHKRIKITQELVDVLELGERLIKMTDLIELLPTENKGKFYNLYERLINLLSQLEKINEQNTELINNSLKVINFSLNTLTANSINVPTYGNRGEDKDQTKQISRILDKRV